jgi:hypothetical protein
MAQTRTVTGDVEASELGITYAHEHLLIINGTLTKLDADFALDDRARAAEDIAEFAALGGISFFGGEGKMAGSVAGAIVLGMLVNLLFYAGFTSFYEYIAEGVILLLVVGFSFWRRSSSRRIPRLPGGAITTSEGGIEAS